MNSNLSGTSVFLIILHLILNQAAVSGQGKKWQDMMSSNGYLVNNGDTVFGSVYIKQKYIDNHPWLITFTGRDSVKRDYTAEMLDAIGIWSSPFTDENDNFYPANISDYESISSPKSGKQIFAERLTDGEIKVFHNRNAMIITTTTTEGRRKFDGIAFNYDSDDGLYIGPSFKTSSRVIEQKTRYSSYFVQKNGGKVIKISKDDYDGLFPALFGDCTAIPPELEKNPELGQFRNFTLMVELYNHLCGE